jgi:hypothetical protein
MFFPYGTANIRRKLKMKNEKQKIIAFAAVFWWMKCQAGLFCTDLGEFSVCDSQLSITFAP